MRPTVFLLVSVVLAAPAWAVERPVDERSAALRAEVAKVQTFMQATGLELSVETTNDGETVPVYRQSGMARHIVAKGDTLFSIARSYGVSVSGLMQANALDTPSIGLGDALVVPARPSPTANLQPATTDTAPPRGRYVVAAGDTLFSVARQACVSVADILSVNTVADPNALRLGQDLSLPDGHCLTS
ncbi:LysM peptidoglycan-binding domain-containing protein [uncultured Algimonas sp.]|uniref:muramidase family protein n=1 Tax=uncultured Algimonas sp. TaxID=1547920 RepID=UPI00261AFF35|nr:LysM peptidoglycan-binding domain-containing protein [uncultured Algimonas sp.]